GVRVRFHRYDGLPIRQVVGALLERLPASDKPLPPIVIDRNANQAWARVETARAETATAPLRVVDIISALEKLDMSQYSFVADVGDGWFIGLELRTEVFLAPGYCGTMGFAVPGALGAGMADRARRPFALVGDGAF